MIVTYRWYITAWQTCSLPCGKGFQQRSVVCRQKIAENKWNTITNETLCVEPKPVVSPLERNCNEISCPPEYVAGQWSEVNKRIYWNPIIYRPRKTTKQFCGNIVSKPCSVLMLGKLKQKTTATKVTIVKYSSEFVGKHFCSRNVLNSIWGNIQGTFHIFAIIRSK